MPHFRFARFGLRRLARWGLGALLVLALALVGYVGVAGVVVGVARWQAPPVVANPVSVYLFADAFHADVLFPIDPLDPQWDGLLRAEGLDHSRETVTHLAVGWGSRTFYLRMRDWSNLNAAIVARALARDRAVLHVTALRGPFAPQPGLYPLRVDSAGLDRLIAFVRESFAGSQSQPFQPIPGARYGDHDAFFEARGRYSPIHTCNHWTGQALRRAGIPVAAWAPFAHSLIWSLPRDGGREGESQKFLEWKGVEEAISGFCLDFQPKTQKIPVKS